MYFEILLEIIQAFLKVSKEEMYKLVMRGEGGQREELRKRLEVPSFRIKSQKLVISPIYLAEKIFPGSRQGQQWLHHQR